MREESGRGERIRTSDLSVPNRALYQAEPRPDELNRMIGKQRCAVKRDNLNPVIPQFLGLPSNQLAQSSGRDLALRFLPNNSQSFSQLFRAVGRLNC